MNEQSDDSETIDFLPSASDELSMKSHALEVASRTNCGESYAKVVEAAKAYYEFLKS